MTDSRSGSLLDPAHRALLRDEVLRWNRQFSLVSRVDPEARVEALLVEAEAAFPVLGDALDSWRPGWSGPGGPSLAYVDIGSGGGFPGLPWFSMLRARGPAAPAGALVEPRRKRAWFLGRCRDRLGLEGLEICECRWGERPLPGDLAQFPEASGRLWILSLQALRLRDDEILSGWRRATGREEFAPGENLAICRFHTLGEPLDDALRDRLGLPAEDARLLPVPGGPRDCALLLSFYSRLG